MMKHTTVLATFVFALTGASAGLPEAAASELRWHGPAFETRTGGFRGRGGSSFRKGGGRSYHKGGRHHHRKSNRHSYYTYPYYYDRNYGGYRKYLPWQNRSWYPNQGGSDYRQWFDLPRSYPRRW